MKRFYERAAATPIERGWTVTLDERPVRTPARAPLVLPTQALAEAVAEEWSVQGDSILPATMPLAGLANAAIDRVAPNRDSFIDELARYAESDLVCYRADHPADLVARQAKAWDPLIAWAAKRYDVAFETVAGIMHRPQPPLTVERLRAALAARDDFSLTPLQPLVTISGSLVIALAFAEGAIDIDAAWAAGQLDELYQVERWGDDPLAAKSREERRASLGAAARFLTLLRPA